MKMYKKNTKEQNELRRMHHKIGCSVFSLMALLGLILAAMGLNPFDVASGAAIITTVAFWGFALTVLWIAIIMTAEGRLLHTH